MIVNAHDENIKLIDLTTAVQNGDEVFIVSDDGMTFQIIRGKPSSKYPGLRPQYGSAEGLIEISDDFDAPLEDFKDYMLAEQPKQESRKFGTAKGMFTMSDDFNAPIDDFDEYR